MFHPEVVIDMPRTKPAEAARLAENPDTVERYRSHALRHCEIVRNGQVNVPDFDRNGRRYRTYHRIILYLIGKFYAARDKKTPSAYVDTTEFVRELRLKRHRSTLRVCLAKYLKSEDLTRRKKGRTAFYALREECVATWLDEINKAYAGRRIPGVVVRRTGIAQDDGTIRLDEKLPIDRPIRVEVAVTIPEEPTP